MRIMLKETKPSGAFYNIQSCGSSAVPDGFYEVADGVELSCGGFGTRTVVDNVVTAFTPDTDKWEKLNTPTIEQVKQNAINRIDGKCSAAIYSGVTIADKHYSLSLVTQQNLKTAQDKITAGATSVIFAADGEEPTVHTAEQITEISNAAYEWGVVNTSYYAKLQKWIVRETDTAILNAIDYGSMLPNDLMTELATLLVGAGIDLAKYSTMLGG